MYLEIIKISFKLDAVENEGGNEVNKLTTTAAAR